MSPAFETVIVRVQRVRRRGQRAAVFSGLAIDATGSPHPRAPRYAVTATQRVLPCEVQEGQWWSVSGEWEDVTYEADGWQVHERQLFAKELELLRPSGEHIVRLLAQSPAFPGIGEVTARKLWEGLGEELYNALEDQDQAQLAVYVGEVLASVLIAGWALYGDADAVRAFQRMGLDISVSQKVLRAYGNDALNAVTTDPYRLLAFGLAWPAVDKLASSQFAVDLEDERRLGAAVEAALYAELERGNTCADKATVEARLRSLVGETHSAAALRLAIQHHYVVESEGLLHALGPWAMEQALSKWFVQLAAPSPALMDEATLTQLVADFELTEATESGAITLNAAQREAVHAAATNRLLLITGGAGVGKTTVLKCVRSMLDRANQAVFQMALSGRAAKRLAEATGKPAMTIAGFLRNVAKEGLPERSTVVVDEASMLDVLLAYRLVGALPEDARLILIGDPFQLPPVGPGLTLHALIEVPQVTRVELTVVKRFGGAIASTASAVRDGALPDLPSTADTDIAFIECVPDEVGSRVLELVEGHPTQTQVLTFTKERGPGGSVALNALCQRALAIDAKRLLVMNDEKGRLEDTGLRLGDPVLCTKNLWHLGVQNGSLGRVHAIEEAPLVDSQGIATYGWVRWDDGELRAVTDEILDALELGYAITVHKSQGSQFPRVVIPVLRARNLDRTMLYTAITRATQQVVLVGDREVAARVVAELPSSARRLVGLSNFARKAFQEH